MAYIRNISGTYMNYIGNIYEIGYMGYHFATFLNDLGISLNKQLRDVPELLGDVPYFHDILKCSRDILKQ